MVTVGWEADLPLTGKRLSTAARGRWPARSARIELGLRLQDASPTAARIELGPRRLNAPCCANSRELKYAEFEATRSPIDTGASALQ